MSLSPALLALALVIGFALGVILTNHRERRKDTRRTDLRTNHAVRRGDKTTGPRVPLFEDITTGS
jgi:hypothetical protein